MASKLLDLDNPDLATAWLIQFDAQIRIDAVDDIEKKKLLFLSKCGVEAIAKLKDLLFPADIDRASYEDIKAAIDRVIKPKGKLVIAERVRFLEMRQLSDESPIDFLTRLNSLASSCSFAQLKNDPEQELIKLVFLAGISSPELKLSLLYHLRIKSDISVLELFNLATTIQSERLFALGAGKLNEPTFSIKNDAVPARRQPQRQPPMHRGQSVSRSPRAFTNQSVPFPCRNCGKQHGQFLCPAYGTRCRSCQRLHHWSKCCRSRSTNFVKDARCEESMCDDAELFCEYSDEPILCTLSSYGKSAAQLSKVNCIINAMSISMQLDSGAVCSILPEEVVRELGISIHPTKRILTAFDGSSLDVVGEVSACIVYGNIDQDHSFVVVKSPFPFGLIGCDLLQYDGTVFCTGKATSYLPVIKGYTASVKCVEGSADRVCAARPVPLHLQNEVSEELKRLESMGIISPCLYEGVRNASPVVWIRKKDGSLRMCADYKVHLNNRINTFSFPTPRFETIFSGTGKAKFFSKIDLQSAYWQIELS